jgi:proteasome accessory factor C
MAKQSAPIQEVARLLDLVPYLSTHSHISLKELAKEFGVDEKAMANELTALSMCGLPGYTPYELIEIFFDSGFVSINNHDALDIPRALTHLEVATLLIGLEIMRDATSDGDERIIEAIDGLLQQLRDLMGSTIEVEESPISSHLAVINSAISLRNSLEIEYLSPVKDEINRRKIDPLSLHSEAGHTYLVAFCHTQSAVRNFRIDRITSVSVANSVDRSRGEIDTEESPLMSAHLKVDGSRRAVAELFGLEQISASGRLEVEFFSPEWLSKAVIAHSPEVSVIGPEPVRALVREKLEKILALYAP